MPWLRVLNHSVSVLDLKIIQHARLVLPRITCPQVLPGMPDGGLDSLLLSDKLLIAYEDRQAGRHTG